MFIRHDISKPHLYPLDVTTMRYGGYARDSHFHLRSLKSKHDLFGESGYMLGELSFRPPSHEEGDQNLCESLIFGPQILDAGHL